MVNRSVLYYENRIALLKNRDPVVNANLIRKLERKLRKIKEA